MQSFVIANNDEALDADARPRAAASPELDDVHVRDLTRAIANGDSAAFGVFYEQWFDRMHSLSRRLTRRDESFCLDVVQDAMLRVVRSLRAVEDPRALERWLCRVVHSTALDHLRREARRRRHEHRAGEGRVESDAADSAAPAVVELEDQIAWLRGRLEALSAEEWRLIDLRFLQGKSLKDTGTALGISAFAAHGRIQRALDRMRRAARRVLGGS